VDENSVENLISELEESAAKFANNGGGKSDRFIVDQDHEKMARRLLHTAREAGHVCTAECQHD
jgi:DNA repair photolyase